MTLNVKCMLQKKKKEKMSDINIYYHNTSQSWQKLGLQSFVTLRILFCLPRTGSFQLIGLFINFHVFVNN